MGIVKAQYRCNKIWACDTGRWMCETSENTRILGLEFAASSGLGRGVQEFSENLIQKSRSKISSKSRNSQDMWNFRGWCSIGRGHLGLVWGRGPAFRF
jgi:hypothetical protein